MQQGLAQYFSHLVHNVSLSRREFWKALKPLRTGTPGRKVRAFSRTVPAVQNEQGILYPDAEALADAWVSHFANIERGTAVHPSLIAGLIQQERVRIEQRGYKGPFKHLPTRQHIELASRKTKTRSAQALTESLEMSSFSPELGLPFKSLHVPSSLLSLLRLLSSPEEASCSNFTKVKVLSL